MGADSAWAIAAALILSEGRPMHCNEITEAVQSMPYAKFGRKGDPYQSMGSILRVKRIDDSLVFCMVDKGSGIYDLVDREWVSQLPDVVWALRRMSS